MKEQPIPTDMQKLFHQLKEGGLAFRRLEAIEKIGRLEKSHPRLVSALVRARELDTIEEVRKAAAEALHIPVHREILESDPGLVEQALVVEPENVKHSVFGFVSFVISIVSILIIYADIFLIMAQPAAFAADGSEMAPPLDVSPLFCLSFLLSLFGLVSGIIGIRQYDRKKEFSRLGLLGNGLIILSTLIISMVVKFHIQ